MALSANVLLLFISLIFNQIFLENNIYIFGRGTESKQNLISKNFNKTDNKLTHIGVGYIEDGMLKIFNVSMSRLQNNSALIVETLEEFTSIKDINYLGIWEFKSTNEDKKELVKIIEKYIKKKMLFDNNFDLRNNDKMYCSEFVAKALNKLPFFNFEPHRKEARKFLKDLTKNDEFIYYPVDFFIEDNRFQLIYEVCY